MTGNQKTSDASRPMLAGLALGWGVEMALLICMSAIAAGAVLFGNAPVEMIGYSAVVILLMTSLMGAIYASAKSTDKNLLRCAASGVIYFATLMGMTALVFGGEFRAIGETALLIACGCIIAIMRNVSHEKNKKKGRKVRRRH